MTPVSVPNLVLLRDESPPVLIVPSSSSQIIAADAVLGGGLNNMLMNVAELLETAFETSLLRLDPALTRCRTRIRSDT